MKLLLKEALKKIKLTFGRFLSVFFIVALGVGFFAGIRNTSDDMLYTASSYYNNKNLMDLRLVSTLGFNDEDVELLKDMDEVSDVEAGYYLDCLDGSNVVRVLSISNNINKVELKEGRMPKDKTEVLGDDTKYKIGDKLTLDTDDLDEKEVTVVGLVESPMYIKYNSKGTTLIGNGKIYAYLYTMEDNFNTSVYTVIYIRGTYTKELEAYTDKYQTKVEELEDSIDLDKLKTRRQEELKNEALEKINEAKSKIDKEKKETEKELSNSKNKLDSAKEELEKQEKKLNDREKEYKEEITKNKNKIKTAKEELKEQEEEYNKQKESLDKAIESFNTIFSVSNYEDIPNLKDMSKEELSTYLPYLTEEQIESLISKQDVINQSKTKLDSAKEELDKAKKTIEENEKTLKEKETTLNNEITSARNKINSSYKKLEESYNTYSYNYDKFQVKIKDAYNKINEQIKKVDEIEKPDIYVFDRNDNAGYEDYESDTMRVSNISKVFPVFFLLVAALVCLNTMSRMVEEDRSQMGIYKSLGFNNFQILFTYILYASFATIFGSIVGLLLGCSILPNVIYNIYSFMYVLPNLKYDNNITTMLLTTLLMFIVTISITLYTALSTLKEYPASLLRPKAPAKGKKVLLENIKFIWKRLNFSFKVTTRNIFRYKKRIFMTVVGIAGCSALTLAGLGLKDSITGIVKIQFNEITNYKAITTLDKSYKTLDKDMEELLEENGLSDPLLIYQELYSYKINNKNNNVYLVVPSNNKELKEYINLRHRTNKKEISFNDNGAIITEKMASNLNVNIGDYVVIYDTNNKEYKIKISEITENYAYNYLYLTPTYYKEVFKDDVLYNMVLSKVNGNKDTISKSLLATKKVLNISFIDDILEQFNDMVSNLNKIVFVILLCSCMLAFIVLYNLTTINITERIREIATLKVLGFTDKEVSLYVYRETMILTVLGALVGLILGVFLHKFVIESAEMEFIMFQRNINMISYIYAFLITMAFSIIISIFTHFRLKKIDMIEALKSVE